jgi:hypothetical protein
MKNYVGARKVNCDKCIFCRQCLIEKEILFTPESQISLSDAIKDEIKCTSCGSVLYSEEEFKAESTAKNSEFK